MAKFERRAYRKSPGRQYGYDYDPFKNSKRSGTSQSGRGDTSEPGNRWSTHEEGTSRPGIQLAQRPDPRRTRQLLRQSILASKYNSAPLQQDEIEQPQAVRLPRARQALDDENQPLYEEHNDSTLYSNRYQARGNRAVQPRESTSQQYIETEGEEREGGEGNWDEFDYVDPDIGYEDPLDRRVGYAQSPSARLPGPRHPAPARRVADPRRDIQEAYEEDEDRDEQDERPARRRAKKSGVTRRKLLVGLGIVAVGGVAAYELGPKIPQALNNVGTNIEHQLQDAYNRGIAAGEEAVRKEFVNALDTLDGVSLSAAINVTRLMRLAYDAFVNPLIKLAATVTGDFLSVTLTALIQGRGFLAKFNQDNDTLIALTTVLQAWVKQVNEVPQEWQTIASSDLDGAQAYLRALQRKIQEEQAKLNGQSTTPTAAPKPTGTPKK